MVRTVTATMARTHFGEIIRQAQDDPVIVERGGLAKVVVISKKAYDILTVSKPQESWRELLKTAQERVLKELDGRKPPRADDLIHEAREIKDKAWDDLH